MIRGSGGIWARRIIALAKIGVSLGYIPQRGATQIAGQLEVCVTTGGEVDELASGRWIVQVIMLIRGAVVRIWNRHGMVE